ncbi:hypothetical protein [Pararhodobacter marinus]|nr:hypothetical protein [Pararhodobacter marinus]
MHDTTNLIDRLGPGDERARWIRWRLLKREYRARNCTFRTTRRAAA